MDRTMSKLFEPVSIGKVRLKNRIAMAPMGIMGLTDSEGSLTQRAVDYYIERVRGGTGLIITGLFKVENEIDFLSEGMPSVSKAILPSLGELCESVHSLGAKIFIQLTAGFGRVARPGLLRGTPVSASVNPFYWDPNISCRPLITVEVEKIVKAFGDAAKIVAASGVDGIEMHGHEGYLFDQFTTAIWNKRTDKYGGSLSDRLTFPIEVLSEIKSRLGSGFPVQYRFGLKHYMKGLNSGALPDEEYIEAGRDIEEGLQMAVLLEKAGFDALHVDAGCYDSWYWPHPPTYQKHGCMLDMAAKVKKVIKIPVITVGKLDIPELAESAIEQGQADIVAIGRGLLADPYWPLKVQEKRTASIRPCIGCHDGCLGRFATGKPLSCTVNPACGRETGYHLNRTDFARRVMVVGGGVAGMECARVAAVRGHKVTLYEKEKSLGGHLIEAAVPDFKEDLKRLLQWYEHELKDAKVEVRLGSAVTRDLVLKENPEVCIVATGSTPIHLNVNGKADSSTITFTDLLLGKKIAGHSAVIIGGGLIGCEVALWLAKQRRQVTILEAMPNLMSRGISVPHMNRVMLLDLLKKYKVQIITQSRVQKITDKGVSYSKGTSDNNVLKVDTIISAIGLEPVSELYRQLQSKFSRVYAIGDCTQPRNIMGAIWDAYEVGRSI